MATNRGGRGGSPELFAQGGGEGSVVASPKAAAAGGGGNPPKNPYEGYDYDAEWAGKKNLMLKDQPNIPSSTDYDGNDKGNRAEVEHHTKRQAAFNTAYEAQKKARPSTAKTDAPKVKRAPEPTNRTVGTHVPQKMGIKEFGQKINDIHTILDTHAKSVGSLQLRPEAEEMHNQATDHLDEAQGHLDRARFDRMGTKVGNKFISGDASAAGHYIKAIASLRKAHDALGHESVSNTAKLNKLSVELPTSHLKDVEEASKTIPILKGGKSFSSIPLGGVDIDPNSINIKEAEKLMGKDTDAVRKVKAGQRGTRRQDKFKVVSGQEEKMLGGLPGKEDRTRGRGGIVSTPINPKRRASRSRRANDRLPNADMSRYATPKFEGAPLKPEDN